MLKALRGFFKILSRTDRFLREPFLWGMNGFMFVFALIIVTGMVGMRADKLLGHNFFIKQTTFLYGAFIYSLLPYIFFKQETLRKYIIFGKKEKIEEISKSFTNKGYVLFVGFFSYFSIIPILGIPLLLTIFKLNITFDYISRNIVVVVYILISISSIIWFSYHIVMNSVGFQKIKVKVAQYIAIASTITLLKVNNLEQFTIVASCLVVSYLWIQYIIELKADEEDEEDEEDEDMC